MTDKPAPNPRRTLKSRSGCLTCKRRRVKCDERVPGCLRCSKIGVECPGYKRPMKWSTKYEKKHPSHEANQRHEQANKSPIIRGTEDTENDETTSEQIYVADLTSTTDSPQPLSLTNPDTGMALSPCQAPLEQSSLLIHHYFSLVCRINSCFDSACNPFRSQVSGMMVQSPLVFYCVLSMSAAHLYQHQRASVALEFQTQAMSHLSSELAGLNLTPAEGGQSQAVTDELLLGIILLGMTSAWHDASSLGLSHLYGSRPLFKSWVASHHLNADSVLSQSQSFMVSLMVYWEAMASFLLDQDSQAVSYLDTFLHPSPLTTTYPSPWTGVATPVFICLAKTGTLLRKKRKLRALDVFKSGKACRDELHAELVEEARALEQEVLKMRLPFVSLIEDTGDIRAPPDHFHRIARGYRLATLLELYRAFPELEADASASTTHFDKSGLGTQAQLVLGLAFGILTLIEGIPDDSSTTPTQNLLLLMAGSALGRVSSVAPSCMNPGILPSSSTSNTSSSTNTSISPNQEITRRRQFVLDRVSQLHLCVGLRPITHVSLVLEEVWTRMDWAMEVGSQDCIFGDAVHWMDVMFEKRLETMLG